MASDLHFTRHTSEGTHWWWAFRIKADHPPWNKCVWSTRAICRTLPGVTKKALHSLRRMCFKSACSTKLCHNEKLCFLHEAKSMENSHPHCVSGHYWRSSQNAKKFYDVGITKTELLSVLSMKKWCLAVQTNYRIALSLQSTALHLFSALQNGYRPLVYRMSVTTAAKCCTEKTTPGASCEPARSDHSLKSSPGRLLRCQHKAESACHGYSWVAP